MRFQDNIAQIQLKTKDQFMTIYIQIRDFKVIIKISKVEYQLPVPMGIRRITFKPIYFAKPALDTFRVLEGK